MITSSNIYWSASRGILSKKFNLDRQTISYGMIELKKMNLIEVEYSSIEEGYESRAPAAYILKKLYDPEENRKKFEQLNEEYGKKDFNQARKYAKIIFKENDPVIVEDIIDLIKEYGENNVKKAYKIVGKKAHDNPKRCHQYAVAVIKDLKRRSER